MANEEHRGDSQAPPPVTVDPTLGLRPPVNVRGVRGYGNIPASTPVNAPQSTQGAQQNYSLPPRVFDTLPLNAKRFSLDYYIQILSVYNTADFGGHPERFKFAVPLIGQGSFDIPRGPGSTIQSFTVTNYTPYQGFITLATSLSFSIFWANAYAGGVPTRLTGYMENPGNGTGALGAGLELSGQVMPQYNFNTIGIDDFPLFMPMAQTDTLRFIWSDDYTAHFLDPNTGLPVLYSQFYLWFKATLNGVLIPDNGQPKEWQVSL